MRLFLILGAVLTLSACQIIYKLPTRQGNVIEQKQLDQLQVGMTREQVHFLLGTPIAASPFREDRWDYVGYYKSPRGQESSRVVTLYFDKDSLQRMEGIQVAGATAGAGVANPDINTVIRQERKDANEDSREQSEEDRESGVVITPTNQQP
jgi:outer membrane protein assembly factor BamE